MDRIKYDAFNAAPFNNHVPEMKIMANKKSMNIITGVLAVAAIGLILYGVYELSKDERER